MHCVDLGESFQTHIFLQILASIQPRTSPVKFARYNYVAACATRGASTPSETRGRSTLSPVHRTLCGAEVRSVQHCVAHMAVRK